MCFNEKFCLKWSNYIPVGFKWQPGTQETEECDGDRGCSWRWDGCLDEFQIVEWYIEKGFVWDRTDIK